jgi:hypothetical protein
MRKNLIAQAAYTAVGYDLGYHTGKKLWPGELVRRNR